MLTVKIIVPIIKYLIIYEEVSILNSLLSNLGITIIENNKDFICVIP